MPTARAGLGRLRRTPAGGLLFLLSLLACVADAPREATPRPAPSALAAGGGTGMAATPARETSSRPVSDQRRPRGPGSDMSRERAYLLRVAAAQGGYHQARGVFADDPLTLHVIPRAGMELRLGSRGRFGWWGVVTDSVSGRGCILWDGDPPPLPPSPRPESRPGQPACEAP